AGWSLALPLWLAESAAGRARRRTRRTSLHLAPRAAIRAAVAIAAKATPTRSPATIAALAAAPLIERSTISVAVTIAWRCLRLSTFLARLGRLEQCPTRQVDPTLAIDLRHQHLDFVADLD